MFGKKPKFGKQPSGGQGAESPAPPPSPAPSPAPSTPPASGQKQGQAPIGPAPTQSPAPEKPDAAQPPAAGSSQPSTQPAPAPSQPATQEVTPAPTEKPAPAKQVEMKHGVPFVRYTDPKLATDDYRKAKAQLTNALLENIDFDAIERLPSREAKKEKISQSSEELMSLVTVPLNQAQIQLLKKEMVEEVLGFGPLELLMNDPEVSDIMVNTRRMIYIEKNGKLALCDVMFTSEAHLMNVIQKIVSQVGRRVDETSPMVDARMPDGSRFNAIVPPIAIDGSLVSIRKFKQHKMPLSEYLKYESMTEEMVKFLEICGNIRLNILISGGTGSGKTTMLNALSGHIDPGERVITIEDAAELQLHQPHVLRLETRPPNMEGAGEITQRMLVKNALRMRPDRIILGEIRSDEVIDVLAAMNTGHEGSMATIHANNPRDCLSRVENLVGLAGIQMPMVALRQQIASALHLIVQVSRMRDGRRRVTHIEEVVGLEGDVITTQQIFGFKPGAMEEDGTLSGEFFCTGIKPKFFDQAVYFNRDKELLESLGIRG